MMTTEAIEAILVQKFPDASIGVMDMTGTADHFEVRISWNGFRGKSLIEQHQMIQDTLKPQLEDGAIHALKIKTIVPAAV